MVCAQSCHAETCADNSDFLRNVTTCTCNMKVPVSTSTPKCSPRNMVDCCTDSLIIENTCPQSPIIISHDCSDLEEEVVLQCSASTSSCSVHSEPNMTCCEREAEEQRNKTCNFTSKTCCDKSKTCVLTKTCPSTVDFAKEWLSNKSCELKHKIQDLICSQPKPCESRHVNFSNLCELSRKHCLGPSPCQSDQSSSRATDESCSRCVNNQDSQSNKSLRYIDIASKLCELCKHVLDPAPGMPAKPCRHVDIGDKLCKRCKYVLASTSCQPVKTFNYIDIAEKLCDACKHILDPAPCRCKPYRNVDIDDNLCEHCQHVLDSAPCKLDAPCQHCDVSAKLCTQCKNILVSAPCKPENPCKLVGIADKVCELCKLILDPAPCELGNSCKHCDISKKLCKECKHNFNCQTYVNRSCKNVDIPGTSRKPCEDISGPGEPQVQSCKNCDITNKLCSGCKSIFDSDPCIDRSCKNVDIANKLCEHCKSIYESSPCQSIKPYKKPVNIADTLCNTCKNFPQVAPCQPDHSCKDCDITEKLCSGCKSIFDSAPYIDRSCKNLDIAVQLCEHCRQIYVSPFCPLDESYKMVHDADKPCGERKVIPQVAASQRHPIEKEGESCKKFEELFINDQASGCLSAERIKSEKCSQSAATLANLSPIIKQEAKSTCFDFKKESVGRSSGTRPESPESSCASARARFYQNKLMATLQILQNKEETVRLQAESIAIAESRIAALNTRHTDLRKEIERKEREIQSLRVSLKECEKCKVNTSDVSITADIQDMDDQQVIVTTLQNNLGVIEDLYRESFYETVKQENLIEMLRKSYLDVRLMDKEKSNRISKLNNVINTQKWSLDRCQDIATEVDNLKMEISNFVNSSNNDSGMWEESVVGGLSEDLQDIAAQLLRLRDVLAGDCTCGLEQENARLEQENTRLEQENTRKQHENTKLKQENECLEGSICGLRAQICNLEANLRKSQELDRQCNELVESKERELHCVRLQLRGLMETTTEQTKCYDTLAQQSEETKESLDHKTRELCCMQEKCRVYEDTVNALKEQLSKYEDIEKENAGIRKELSCVSRRAARVQRRAAELEPELERARERAQRIEAAFREKVANSEELERSLEAAQARGAELCAEAGRVLRAVRCWAARMRALHREQEKQIKHKECKLRCIQNELHRRQLNICPRLWEEVEEECSSRPSASGTSQRSESNCPTAACCAGESRRDGTGSSGSEMASCSSRPACSAAADPSDANSSEEPACSSSRACGKPATAPQQRRYGWLGSPGAARRHAAAQRPARRDAACQPPRCAACAGCRRTLPARGPAPVTPGEEMFSRMENLSAALADGYRRWSRRADPASAANTNFRPT